MILHTDTPLYFRGKYIRLFIKLHLFQFRFYLQNTWSVYKMTQYYRLNLPNTLYPSFYYINDHPQLPFLSFDVVLDVSCVCTYSPLISLLFLFLHRIKTADSWLCFTFISLLNFSHLPCNKWYGLLVVSFFLHVFTFVVYNFLIRVIFQFILYFFITLLLGCFMGLVVRLFLCFSGLKCGQLERESPVARLGGESRLPHCYWFTALRGVEPLPNKTDKLRFCEPVKSRILPGHTRHFELGLLLQQARKIHVRLPCAYFINLQHQ